uniref:hypothetical protein n=1 Tax=Methylobacterium sp. B34 TaxID=95563 RepID=UPI000348B1A0|nr:hypothetical protein [Methylobacterium sp. B34]
MFGWFSKADRTRIMTVVEKLETVATAAPSPFDAHPEHKTNPKAYYQPATGTWAIGDIRFLAPEQDRAVQALEVALPVIKALLDDKVTEDVVNDLTFDVIKTLIDKGVV